MSDVNYADIKTKILLINLAEMAQQLEKLTQLVTAVTMFLKEDSKANNTKEQDKPAVDIPHTKVNPFYQPMVVNPFYQPMVVNPFCQEMNVNPFCQEMNKKQFDQDAYNRSIPDWAKPRYPFCDKKEATDEKIKNEITPPPNPPAFFQRAEYKPPFTSLQEGNIIYLHTVKRIFKIGSIWVKIKKNFNNEGSDIYQLCDFIKSSSASLSIDINSPFFTNIVELVCLKPDNTLIPVEVNITRVKFFYDKGIKTLNDLSSLEGKHLIVLRTGVSYIVDSDQYGKFIFI